MTLLITIWQEKNVCHFQSIISVEIFENMPRQKNGKDYSVIQNLGAHFVKIFEPI